MTIPTGTMTRALTDKERKAVHAEKWRLTMMLQDDDMYWRRGEKPPVRKVEPKYTVDDLRRDRPDLLERTKLPRGHPQRLTLPRAKRAARKAGGVFSRPDGIYYFKHVDGEPVEISEAEAKAIGRRKTCTAIVGPIEALYAYSKRQPWPPVRALEVAA
jgi:hypothetical protein